MRFYGQIYEVDKSKRIYKVKTKYQMYYIYFKRSLMHTFKNYLSNGNFIDLEVLEPKKYDKYICYQAYYINKLKSLLLNKVYFAKEENIKVLKYLLKNINNVLVLDLEMTMPPYNSRGSFNSEIIQVAYILYDKFGHSLINYSKYVKPEEEINSRTCNFLNIKKREFYNEAISFYRAYKDFKQIIKKYHPTIIVYGKNDILTLKRSFNAYNLPDILQYARIINLSSLIQNYYHHLNEYGLFNLYDKYYNKELIQIHNALSDAYITYKVYKAFSQDVLNDKISI